MTPPKVDLSLLEFAKHFKNEEVNPPKVFDIKYGKKVIEDNDKYRGRHEAVFYSGGCIVRTTKKGIEKSKQDRSDEERGARKEEPSGRSRDSRKERGHKDFKDYKEHKDYMGYKLNYKDNKEHNEYKEYSRRRQESSSERFRRRSEERRSRKRSRSRSRSGTRKKSLDYHNFDPRGARENKKREDNKRSRSPRRDVRSDGRGREKGEGRRCPVSSSSHRPDSPRRRC